MPRKISQLSAILDSLKASPAVSGVMLTGSSATNPKPYSDIDLVVILRKNPQNIRSVFTDIDGQFSDIFFFDERSVRRLSRISIIEGNSIDGMLYTWIRKGRIVVDRTKLLVNIQKSKKTLSVIESEKQSAWVKMNYMAIENERYFRSGKTDYHQALELQLPYSVVELTTAFLQLRGIPWRGEREALWLLRQKYPNFAAVLRTYFRQMTLQGKMREYRRLLRLVVTRNYPLWKRQFLVPLRAPYIFDRKLVQWWKDLIRP